MTIGSVRCVVLLFALVSSFARGQETAPATRPAGTIACPLQPTSLSTREIVLVDPASGERSKLVSDVLFCFDAADRQRLEWLSQRLVSFNGLVSSYRESPNVPMGAWIADVATGDVKQLPGKDMIDVGLGSDGGAIADPARGLAPFNREDAFERSPAGLFRWDPATGEEEQLSDVAEVPIAKDASRDPEFCLACGASVGAWTRATLLGWAEFFPGGLRGTTRGVDPTLSPDGRFLVVERSGRLVLVDLATGSERDLGPGIRPSWSP